MNARLTRLFEALRRVVVNETPTGFFARLKQRKLVQWAVAYVAAAFAALQGIDIVATRFGWPGTVERLLIIVENTGQSRFS